MSLRYHAVEEVYELIDAIETNDMEEMKEELGDLLLQVVFHCQLARERKRFDLEEVARHLIEKLVRRHPHVFGESKAKDVDAVWAQWEQIKRAETKGTAHDRPSALDGIPSHLPALMRVEKLVKKARKAKLLGSSSRRISLRSAKALGKCLFDLTEYAQSKGWSAEETLRAESQTRERQWRKREQSVSRFLSSLPLAKKHIKTN